MIHQNSGCFASVVLVLGLAGAAVAEPVKYNFVGVSNNNPADVASGDTQLYMLVDSVAGNKVSFAFHNESPGPSLIARI